MVCRSEVDNRLSFLVSYDSVRGARGQKSDRNEGWVKSWLSKNSIDSRWTFSLKSGNVPSVPGSPPVPHGSDTVFDSSH